MIIEAKEMLEKDVSSVTKELLQNIELIEPQNGKDYILLQKKIIDAGQNLESRYGLEGTPLINHFEILCEIVYAYSRDGIPEDGIDCLRVEINKLSQFIDGSLNERILSIGAIVKNEVPYLEEWIEYHLMLGIEHFYIYDNNSTDGLYDFLQYYVDRGIVTYIPYPTFNQMAAYMNACTSFKYATKYIAFIDVDEFLVPVHGNSLPEVLEDIFAQYPYAGGLAVNWRVYGTSFYEDKPDGLVIENYIYRQEGLGSASLARKFNPADNAHVKTICNPRRVIACNNPHFFEYVNGAYQISEYGTVFSGPFFAEGRCDKIRLNHYYTKSKSEFYERRRRGIGERHISEEAIDALWGMYKDVCNECRDEMMNRYVAQLKERMQINKRWKEKMYRNT